MAVDVANGTLTVLSTDTVGTTKTVSGLSFQPKAVILFWGGMNAANSINEGNHKFGVGVFTGTSSRRVYTTHSQHGAANAVTGSLWRSDSCMGILTGGGALAGLIDVNAINSDGFQLIVDDDIPADFIFSWLALGGSDISNVAIVDITSPGSATTQDVTCGFALNTGADDKAVIFVGGNASAANTIENDSKFCLGVAALNTPANAVLSGSSVHNAATSVTNSYCRAGECIAVAYNDAVGQRASVTSWLSDGFRLTWAESAAATTKLFALVIKGGRWFVGDGVTSTGGTNQVESTPYVPKALFVGSAGKTASTSDTADADDERIVGCVTSTSARSTHACIDKDNQATMDIGVCEDSTQFYINLSNAATVGIEGSMDLVSFDATPSFTFVMDDPDPSAAFFWYLGAADAPAGDTNARLLGGDLLQSNLFGRLVV